MSRNGVEPPGWAAGPGSPSPGGGSEVGGRAGGGPGGCTTQFLNCRTSVCCLFSSPPFTASCVQFTLRSGVAGGIGWLLLYREIVKKFDGGDLMKNHDFHEGKMVAVRRFFKSLKMVFKSKYHKMYAS